MSMTATLKVQPKGHVRIPLQLWNEAGLATGALLQATARRGTIVLTSKAVTPPDDEYTAAQRRFINRRLARGLEDVRQGRLSGPFDTAEEMAASIEGDVRKIRTARKSKRRR